MSLGRSQSRFALSYVDELLANFAVHPQKSIQNVFQRLLVTCGGSDQFIAEYVAGNLLSSAGLSDPTLPTSLSEAHAVSLISLIFKFATEEQPGRSDKEKKGAAMLFNALAECTSKALSKSISMSADRNPNSKLVETIAKILSMSHNNQHVAFYVSLAGGDIAGYVERAAEEALIQFFTDFSSKTSRCPLRTEYIVRTLIYCNNCSIATLCVISIIRFINLVIHDDERDPLQKRPLQSILYAFLGKKQNIAPLVTYDRILHQAADIIKRGVTNLTPIDAARRANRLIMLGTVLVADGGKCTHDVESLVSFLNHFREVAFIVPDTVASAVVEMTSSELRENAINGSLDKGVLPWNAQIMAHVFNSNGAFNWVEMLKAIEGDVLFRLPSKASLQFFFEFLSAGFQRGFPMDLMYKKWEFVDGQIDFFQRVLECDTVCLDAFTHTPADLSMLISELTDDDLLNWQVRNWKCLELVRTLIIIEDKHPGVIGRVTDMATDFIGQYPDMFLIILLQAQAPLTRFWMDLVKMSLESLLSGHKNCHNAVRYMLHNIDPVVASFLKPQHLLMQTCLDLHQRYNLTSSPGKKTTLFDLLEAMNKLDPEVGRMLLLVQDIRTSFELAVLAENTGMCTFSNWLDMRKDFDEAQLFEFLCGEQWLSLSCTSNVITARIMQFCSNNKEIIRSLGLSATAASSKASSVHSTPAKVRNTAKLSPEVHKDVSPQLEQEPEISAERNEPGTSSTSPKQPAVVEKTPESEPISSLREACVEQPATVTKSEDRPIAESIVQPIVKSMEEEFKKPITAPSKKEKTPLQFPKPTTSTENTVASALLSSAPQIPPGYGAAAVKTDHPRHVPMQQQPHPISRGMPMSAHQMAHMPPSLSMPPPPIALPPQAALEALQQQMAMKESGRSSSVSSTGRAPLGNFPSIAPDPRMQRQFPNNVSAPYNPMNSYMQQAQATGNPVGLNNMFGANSFGGSQELIRAAAPSNVTFGANSPTNQPRPGIPQAPQRQNSSSSCWSLPGAGPAQRPAGPPTPSQQIDFRAQHPPTGAQTDFQARPSGSQAIFDGDLSQMQFPEDVQEEANSYFEQIYTPNPVTPVLTVPILLEKLKNFKASSNSRDQKILACVVKNLFEEYRFFNEYPVRELEITAELYGGIIREGIINEHSNLHFATAVRKVIESLQQAPTTNLFKFGLVSLEHCRTKLCAYPKVCSMIANLETFQNFPKKTQEFVLAGMTGDVARLEAAGRSTPPVWNQTRPPPSAAQATGSADAGRVVSSNIVAPPGRTGNNVLSYTNAETLVKATEIDGADVVSPGEEVVDKMAFLFNNLSQSNMNAKKEEVLLLIDERGEPFIKWLAQYIVMKRVSIEQNFQPLYNTFVQLLNHPLLDQHIKKETFRNIRILLRSDKRQAASNYSDRQLLKNLGLWLGAITIARSKPILINELDLKSLLMEAYYKGQQELLFVVPFIAKILLACSKTTIFTASCAWIRSILKILAELHNEPDLKINLKFEIEVLCKELNVDLNSLPMEGVLKDTDRLLRVQQQLSELKLLARPDVLPSSSPVPNQMRGSGENVPTPGNETKPSTPAPEGENGANVPPEQMPQSHFAYHDINVISYEGLAPHLQIKQNLPLFQLHPQLKHMVRHALTMAIKELIGPVSERAQKIAMTVTENLIRKDFALDPDEKNLKTSAFHMMRAMTAGMAMITCRDPLAATMVTALQSSFAQALRNSMSTPDNAKMIEEAASIITQENVELATNFIVKTACEKAASEMEKRLETEFQRRAAARSAGQTFTDETAEKIQAQLPTKIANAPGPTKKELLDIYAQFSSRICGFKSTISEEAVTDQARPIQLNENDQARVTEHLTSQLNMIIKEVDTTMNAQPNVGNKAYIAVGVIRELLSQLIANPRDVHILGGTLSKSVEHFLHAYHVDPTTKNPLDVEWPRRLRDLFLGVTRLCLNITSIQEIARRITSTIVALNVDYKWNVEAMEVLFKHNLLQCNVLDQHMSLKIVSGPMCDQATFFAQKFMRLLTQVDSKTPTPVPNIKETFPATCEQLHKISQLQQPNRIPVPGEMNNLNSPLFFDGENAEGGEGLSTKVVEGVLREWIGLCYQPLAQRSPQDALSTMIHIMHEHGCLSTDEKVSSFFKMCTEMCVDVTQRLVKSDPGQSAHQSTVIRQRCYYTLDAYVKLIALMIKYSDGNQAQTKITLLKKVLSIISNVLQMDHDCRPKEFNAMPYHRILITLFNELTTLDGTQMDTIQPSVLEAFGQVLFMLQPRRAPMFSYAWLDIVGHRNVIGKLLGGNLEPQDSMKMAAMYTQLIICHLKFMAPFLRNIQLPKSVAMLYKGTLRVLLVILHDFPELLCEFHYVICDTIPANCVQLRNLVLSAYPRNMRLPDPFALNFKQVDSIPDMAQEPKSNLNMTTIIPESLRVQLEDYLANRTNVDFLTTLPGLLQMSQTPGAKYNTTVLNAVVLYVGIKAIENLHQKRMHINIHTIAHTAYMDVFQNLAVQLCTEGRYLLFNAIANQLRYPNAHTHYFSCVFLFLFLNSDCDAIQEQITRILFERLVALRPHPWGLLITFIELIKNPVYNFWKFEFTRCAPEIERLFQNVANTVVSSSRIPAEPSRT